MGRGPWAPNLRLAREQVDGMLGRSEASFCLFLVPPALRAECWMVPARLVRGLMEAQGSLSTVSREGAQRVARSLAQWMTYELLGLWSGDDRPEVLERALGARRGVRISWWRFRSEKEHVIQGVMGREKRMGRH